MVYAWVCIRWWHILRERKKLGRIQQFARDDIHLLCSLLRICSWHYLNKSVARLLDLIVCLLTAARRAYKMLVNANSIVESHFKQLKTITLGKK